MIVDISYFRSFIVTVFLFLFGTKRIGQCVAFFRCVRIIQLCRIYARSMQDLCKVNTITIFL